MFLMFVLRTDILNFDRLAQALKQEIDRKQENCSSEPEEEALEHRICLETSVSNAQITPNCCSGWMEKSMHIITLHNILLQYSLPFSLHLDKRLNSYFICFVRPPVRYIRVLAERS